MKMVKRMIVMLLAVALVATPMTFTKIEKVSADDFVITAPTNDKLLAAGHNDLKWNAKSGAKEYNIYMDGALLATTKDTSYEFYSVKVNFHRAWIEAVMPDGSKYYTPTRRFTISKKGLGIDTTSYGGQHCYPWAFNLAWYYNWGRGPADEPAKSNGFGDIEYVHMAWNGRDVEGKVAEAKAAGCKYILGFNEPDGSSQANMTVDTVVSLWPKLLNQGLYVGSPAYCEWPAASEDGTQKANEQFVEFFEKSGGKMDFICIHSYPWNWDGGSRMADYFVTRIKRAYEVYHKPIWLTEFSTSGEENHITEEGTRSFIEYLLPQLDKLDCVERYAWFPTNRREVKQGLFWFGNGGLSVVGEEYAKQGNPNSYYAAGNLGNPADSGITYIAASIKVPGKTKIVSLKNIKKKTIKVKLKKANNANGYQIKYSTSKKFKKAKSMISTKVTFKVKKLKKKKYYFKARAYALNGKNKKYSAWSGKKSKKVKK
ncbi:MAG: hypothetical protein IJF94_04410 [Eubacterium sp.]|nr:hypothetical protein [Eubacterium sp.]